jgi:hypothetical protein
MSAVGYTKQMRKMSALGYTVGMRRNVSTVLYRRDEERCQEEEFQEEGC